MTFEEIARVSDSLKLIPIKNNEYATVNQRVKGFRMLMPEGSIETELVKWDNGLCVVKATVRDADGKILSTGMSYEREGSSRLNETSFLENCETSAVGRALGFIGLGIEQGMASADEMQIALEKQEAIASNTNPKKTEPKKSEEKKEDKYGETRLCFDCNNIIIPAEKKDKSGFMTAKELADYSMSRYGRFLCSDCMHKQEGKK